MAAHTPLPWTLTPEPCASWIGSIGNNQNDPQLWSVAAPYPKGDKQADAALIVKTVNSHDALVTALSTIADIGEGSQTINSLPHIAKIARAALASIKDRV